MLESTVFLKINSEHVMEPGFSPIQSEIIPPASIPNPSMLSITKINTTISANSMLNSDMEFFVSSAEAHGNVSKRDQVSAGDRMRCLAPNDPFHWLPGDYQTRHHVIREVSIEISRSIIMPELTGQFKILKGDARK